MIQIKRISGRNGIARPRSDAIRAAWAILVPLAFAFAVTCARPAAPEVRSIAPAVVEVATPDAGAGARHDAAPHSEQVVATNGDEEQPSVRAGPLKRFRSALDSLRAGDGRTVRVLWFGDSHTAADYWTHSVRRGLQAYAGDGGPGFIHVGLRDYRHSEVRVETTGQWKGEPRAPSSRSQTDDGVFGLSGMRVRATAGATATLRLVEPPSVNVVWRVAMRFGDAGARVGASLGGTSQTFGRTLNSGAADIVWEELSGPANLPLVISVLRGEAELFGVIGELEQPGVVLDTLGINGARVQTALAWTESEWNTQLALRAASLVVLSYGTNEVFDALDPARYDAQYEALLGRIRGAIPDVDCLLIGPTDVARNGAEGDRRAQAIDAVQRGTARRLGCAHFSAFDSMGASSGFEMWRQSEPQMALPDGVHLTRAGYDVLGSRLTAFLLDSASDSPGSHDAPQATPTR